MGLKVKIIGKSSRSNFKLFNRPNKDKDHRPRSKFKIIGQRSRSNMEIVFLCLVSEKDRDCIKITGSKVNGKGQVQMSRSLSEKEVKHQGQGHY